MITKPKKLITMKKLNYLISMLAMAAVVVFAGCSSDDEEDPEPQGASVNLINAGADYITADAVVAPGDSLKFRIIAEKGDANMETINFFVENQSQNNFPVDAPDNSQFTYDIRTAAPTVEGEYTYEIMITDKDGVTGSAVVDITVDQGAPSSTEFTGKTLGAQQATAGSYFSSENGTVYGSDEASANASVIDFSFAQIGSDNVNPEIISPDYRDERDLSEFSGGTVTYYQSSSLNYDNVTDQEIANISIAENSDNKYIQVSEGQVYAFINEWGKKGIFRVDSYTPGDNPSQNFEGTITISVKVQE